MKKRASTSAKRSSTRHVESRSKKIKGDAKTESTASSQALQSRPMAAEKPGDQPLAEEKTFPIVGVGASASVFEHPEVGTVGLAVHEDITERKRTREEVAKSRDFYLKLFDEFPALIRRSGTDTKCNYFNKSWLRFTGRNLEQELGDGWAEGVHPEDVDRCVRTYLDAFKNRQPFDMEYRLRRYDGEYRWIIDFGRPFYDLDDNFAGYLASCWDITKRKRAEEKFRGLVEAAPDAMVITNQEGKIVLVNTQTEKLFGYMREEMLGQDILMLIPERLRERHQQHSAGYFVAPRKRLKADDLELYGLHKDGHEFRADISLGPVNTEEGIVVSSVIRDITGRKLAEEERARLAAIVKYSHDAIFSTTLDETIITWNPGAEKMYGYAADEIKGQSILVTVPPARRDELTRINEKVKQGEHIEEFETVRLRKDGKLINVAITVSPIKDTAGKVVAISSIVRDLTERKQAEEALSHQTLILQSILDSMGDGVIVVDANGKVVLLNPAAEQIHSITPPNVVRDGLTERYGPYLPDMVTPYPADKLPLARILRGEMADGVEMFVRHPRAPEGVWVSANARPLKSEDNTLLGGVAVIHDITESKLAEQELINSREQLRNLTTYLHSVREEERAHIAREIHDELGQALTALKMDVSLLSRRLPQDREFLPEKTKAMSTLIDSTIQTVQRISTELRPGLLDDLGLSAAIEWQAEQFRGRSGTECEVILDPEDIVIDREQSTAIFRIFQETLTNIARHAQATKVKVRLLKGERKLVLRVRDNGKGISKIQIADSKSLGLIGMRERLHPWRGTVKIRGIQNQGTIVSVSLPLE